MRRGGQKERGTLPTSNNDREKKLGHQRQTKCSGGANNFKNRLEHKETFRRWRSSDEGTKGRSQSGKKGARQRKTKGVNVPRKGPLTRIPRDEGELGRERETGTLIL